MARVVQRRTPPYLTILFAILFVFATILAVLFFNKYTTFEEKYKAANELRRQFASNEQVNDPKVRQMRNAYEKSRRSGGVAQTVVAQLEAQVRELGQQITGLPNTGYLEAIQEVEKTFATVAPPVRRGLTKHMVDFHKELGVRQAAIDKLAAEKAQLSQQVQQLQTSLEAARNDFAAKLKAKDDEIAALDAKFQAAQQDHNQKLADAAKEYQDSVAQLKKQLADQAAEISKIQREAVKWQRKYDQLVKQRETLISEDKVVRRPDGKIIRVLPTEGIVYINIGSKDRVTEGLRLSVFPYTGIPEAGAGKGAIEVTNVEETVSECRILRQNPDEPITPGDLVANLVYDSLRTYSFVVEGDFDIEGTGRPSPAGNNAIRELVRRYGGRIVKDVAVETDYVILGDPPTRPRKPDDTDPQDAWDLYQRGLKVYNRYQEVKQLAESLRIPRLSGQRFLDLVGHTPTQLSKGG